MLKKLIKTISISSIVLSMGLGLPALAAKPDAPAAFYNAPQLSQSFDFCLPIFPKNDKMPVVTAFSADMKGTELCSNHFAVFYSKTTKTPLVVVEKLSRAIIADAKGESRTDDFFPDPRIKRSDSASLDDYKGSGFDRGHMANAADSPDQESMHQTFALTNMIPQDPVNNRKIFSKLESDIRKYVMRSSGNIFVYTGPLYAKRPADKIGKNGVWVPSHIFKLVYDESQKRAWAYILPNDETPLSKPMSYADFVSKTGMKFLPEMQ